MRRGIPGRGPRQDAGDPRETKLRRQKLSSGLSFSAGERKPPPGKWPDSEKHLRRVKPELTSCWCWMVVPNDLWTRKQIHYRCSRQVGSQCDQAPEGSLQGLGTNVIKYNVPESLGVAGVFFVGPCQGLRNYTMIWCRRGLLGEGKGVRAWGRDSGRRADM